MRGLEGLGVDKVSICYTIEPNPNGADQSLAVLRSHGTDPRSGDPEPAFFEIRPLPKAVGHAYFRCACTAMHTLPQTRLVSRWGRSLMGLGETSSLLWNAYIQQGWAGGTKRRFECVSTRLVRFRRIESTLLVQKGTQDNITAELFTDIAWMIADGKPCQPFR